MFAPFICSSSEAQGPLGQCPARRPLPSDIIPSSSAHHLTRRSAHIHPRFTPFPLFPFPIRLCLKPHTQEAYYVILK